MAPIPLFDLTNLQEICNILGDTNSGLTGAEIGRLLANCDIYDPLPGHTKRERLLQALHQRQQRDGCGNLVVSFIQKSMSPVRYTDRLELFNERREKLNVVLAFSGLSLGEDGELRETAIASTLTEARERAGRLRKELIARNIHPDVLKFCIEELLHDNYFHAVFEATKSVADKIREKSSLTDDGYTLVERAFGGSNRGTQILAFNNLRTGTERSENTGLIYLLQGLFSTFRNPTAHEPRAKWVIEEQDALDMLSLVSLLHRRLDRAIRNGP